MPPKVEGFVLLVGLQMDVTIFHKFLYWQDRNGSPSNGDFLMIILVGDKFFDLHEQKPSLQNFLIGLNTEGF